jgi:hypothetical protein
MAMPNQRHDHPLPPIAWIAACNPAEGTFAAEAVSGTYYHITCLGCRREVVRSARQFCAAGVGEARVANCHSRLECNACGHRGASILVCGNWTGAWQHRPEDWAETVEARMPNRYG